MKDTTVQKIVSDYLIFVSIIFAVFSNIKIIFFLNNKYHWYDSFKISDNQSCRKWADAWARTSDRPEPVGQGARKL